MWQHTDGCADAWPAVKQQKGGEAGGAVGLREHLVSYLQQQIEPFAEHLDRVGSELHNTPHRRGLPHSPTIPVASPARLSSLTRPLGPCGGRR